MLHHLDKAMHELVSPAGMQEIEQWVAKYPPDQKQSAVMSVLMTIQDEHGYLTTPLMDAVARYLEMSPIAVYEVASFYSMYEHEPTGRHRIHVCTNVSCQLRDCASVIQHLEQRLGIKMNETTADGRFSLRTAECLGACVNAPMMQVDKNYHENLSADNIDAILDQYE